MSRFVCSGAQEAAVPSVIGTGPSIYERLYEDPTARPYSRRLEYLLGKSNRNVLDGSGSEEPDEDFYVAFNAHCEPVEFIIPPELGHAWRVVIYTADGAAQHVRLP